MSYVAAEEKDVSAGSYKRERDRFVFFAFAGADILIELDSEVSRAKRGKRFNLVRNIKEPPDGRVG